jgi:hypothetical protein
MTAELAQRRYPGRAGARAQRTARSDRPRRAEARLGMVRVGIGVALVVLLIQPLLIIFGGLVVASMLDGGVRLLGRVLPIPRTLRL